MPDAANGATISLLILDDNPGSVELLQAALQQDGSGDPDARPIPKTRSTSSLPRHPEIVLTDLVMPKMSGMEVLERIMEFDPSTDVILMTAHYSTESAVEAIKKGASDYLNKPVSIPTLRQKIEKLLGEARKRTPRLAARRRAPRQLQVRRHRRPQRRRCGRCFRRSAAWRRTTARC